MCVIAYSPKGVEAPSEEQIRAMFETNSDGAGYAYVKGGKVHYKKGFMCVEDLLKELKPLDQWKEIPLAMHFRIGTAGKNDKHTCHPFPLTTDFGEMRKTEGEGPVLFHNGILAGGGLLNEQSSDTQDFVAAFAPMLKKYNKSKVRDAWMEDVVKGNRILIMYNDGKVKMYGEWEKDGELFVSNKHYEWRVNTYKYKTPYAYAYDYYDDDYYAKYYGGYSSFWAKKEKEAEEKEEQETEKAMRVLNKNEANRLWKKLKKEHFLWTNDYEMDLLVEYADEFHDTWMIKDGEVFWMDQEGMYVYADEYEQY